MSSSHKDLVQHAAASLARAQPHFDGDDTAIIGVELDVLDAHLASLEAAFPTSVRHSIAIKTMPHPHMLAHLTGRGFGLEAASIEEVKLALSAGAAATDVIFDSPVKTRSEIAWCQDNLVGGLLNANSIAELDRYPAVPAFQVGLRINPGVSTGAPAVFDVSDDRSKFGASINTDRSALVEACVRAGVTALHMHIGSQVPTCDAHVEAVGLLLELAATIDGVRAEGHDERRITTFDIGGGVHAEPNGHLMSLYGERLQAEYGQLFDYDVRTEFGQWIHANAGWAATRIESVEERSVPIAFGHLGADYFMRDVYGSTAPMAYRFAVVRPDGRIVLADGGAGPTRAYDLVGPLCFAGDVLARDLVLPELAEGDWLVIAGTGANTLGLWSRHCSRAIPKVIASRTSDWAVWSDRQQPV